MTARSYGTARPGRIRSAGLAAVVMTVLLLAATALFSAAAAHHTGSSHTGSSHTGGSRTQTGSSHMHTGGSRTHPGVPAATPVAVHHQVAHEHQHGNGWIPPRAQRFRVLAEAAVAVVSSVIVAPAEVSATAGAAAGTADSSLRLLGILRI